MKRNTVQRDLVLEAVKALRSHATAEEVYRAVAREHPRVARGTVYRNLNQLAADGEIQKLEMPEGPDRFDHRTHRHYHAKGARCGRVLDVEMDYRADLAGLVKDAHGFSIEGHNLVFTGLCSACREESGPKAGEDRP